MNQTGEVGQVRPLHVNVQKGFAGSAWPLRPAPIRRISANMDPWFVELFPGVPWLFLSCSKPGPRVEPVEHRRKAERALDSFSWDGAGHYELVPIDGTVEHLLWDWSTPRPKAQLTVLLETKLPFSLMTGPKDDPAKDIPKTNYTPALRYYRCAQTASNPVAGFQNLYLAFEYLAGQRIPMQPDESERGWLRRIIQDLPSQYPEMVLKGLEPESLGDAFFQRVYEAARCATFHAKPQKGPVAPYDDQEKQVRRAYELLMPHVTELLRAATGRPVGHRVMADKEVEALGESLVEMEDAHFVLNRPAEKTDSIPSCVAWDEGQLPRTFCLSAELDPGIGSSISAVGWRLGPMRASHSFRIFPTASEPLRLAIRLVTTSRFDGLVQSPVSPLDHVAPIRLKPPAPHQLP